MPFRLVLRNILSHRLRSGLTFGSVVLAVFLLCILRATIGAMTAAVEQAATNRLWVQSKVSLFVNLPMSYGAKIAGVDGVEWITRWQWFGGKYQDESGFFAQFGVDPETFLKSYPEITIIDGSYEAFSSNRTGCVIGTDLAADYGWKVGDRVPLIGTIFPRAGDEAWEFTVEGIYESSAPAVDEITMYFHYDYLRESLEQGQAFGPEGVGVYMIKMVQGGDAAQVLADVDALFENGPQAVQTTTEAEFVRQFMSMLGNVPALLSGIGGAVLFSIFFAVLNTMLMAGRERIRDIGIMKALGFSDRAVFGTLVLEALVLCVAGGLLGVVAALGVEEPMQRAMAQQIPGFEISTEAITLGLGLAVGLGLISGTVPGWVASRIAPVRALRMEA